MLHGLRWEFSSAFRIGRNDENEIVINDPSVGRRHAEIGPSGSGWGVCDLGSVNGKLYGIAVKANSKSTLWYRPNEFKANNWQFGNYHRYSNPDLDAVVDSLRKETDQKKRNDLAIKANDILVSDVVVIPLINRTFATSGVSKSLKGVDPTPWDSEMWNIADWTK